MNIDEKNAEKCIILLKKHFINEDTTKIANVEFPVSIIYKSEEWLHYIFYSCLLDYGMRSKLYHMNLIEAYNKYPKIFNPKYIVENYSDDECLLNNFIKNNIHPRYPNVATKKWLYLSSELVKYKSLLQKIQNFQSFEELSKFIKSIKGYGQKTGGLLLRLITESGIVNFNDDISTIPLDRHDIEISYSNDIINTSKLNQLQIVELSNVLISSGRKHSISPNDLDKYLWQIGNEFCNNKKCLECPLNNSCKTKINR